MMDLIGAAICLVLVSPILAATTIAIWIRDGRPIFFRQQRIGRFGRPFTVFKFRSMRINNLPLDDVSEIRKGHPLVTGVGNFIRRYKIDELPQLFNVLIGDMSLIGPRPTIIEQVMHYSAFQWRRLEVRPGLTGWGQVNGGIDISWPDRIMLDVWYVDHQSFWLDVQIYLRTIQVVLLGERSDELRLEQARTYAAKQADRTESVSQRVGFNPASDLCQAGRD